MVLVRTAATEGCQRAAVTPSSPNIAALRHFHRSHAVTILDRSTEDSVCGPRWILVRNLLTDPQEPQVFVPAAIPAPHFGHEACPGIVLRCGGVRAYLFSVIGRVRRCSRAVSIVWCVGESLWGISTDMIFERRPKSRRRSVLLSIFEMTLNIDP